MKEVKPKMLTRGNYDHSVMKTSDQLEDEIIIDLLVIVVELSGWDIRPGHRHLEPVMRHLS
jgi:hypothetical protein